ncbi:MAG: hypothetical protein AAFQ98_02045 [Bacteroidota bacterium]
MKTSYFLLLLLVVGCSAPSKEQGAEEAPATPVSEEAVEEATEEVAAPEVKRATPVAAEDSLLLVELYTATGGAQWTQTWSLADPVRSWFGVEVNEEGRVFKLELPNNNLRGQIPRGFLLNEALETLNFSGNPALEGRAFTFGYGLLQEYGVAEPATEEPTLAQDVWYSMVGGAEIFATPQGDASYATLPEEQALRLDSGFVWDPANDTLIQGISGQYLPIQVGDSMGYVFSGYLSQLPPLSIIQDYVEELRLDYSYRTSSGMTYYNPDSIINEYMGEYNANQYWILEKGVQVIVNDGYEWGGQTLLLPIDEFSRQEAFLLSVRLMSEAFKEEFMANGYPRFPVAPENWEKSEDDYCTSNYTTEYSDGEFQRISFEEYCDCGSSESFGQDEQYYFITTDYGC